MCEYLETCAGCPRDYLGLSAWLHLSRIPHATPSWSSWSSWPSSDEDLVFVICVSFCSDGKYRIRPTRPLVAWGVIPSYLLSFWLLGRVEDVLETSFLVWFFRRVERGFDIWTCGARHTIDMFHLIPAYQSDSNNFWFLHSRHTKRTGCAEVAHLVLIPKCMI